MTATPSIPRSPLAPPDFPKMPAVAGVVPATARAGIKYRDRDDLLLIALPRTTKVAGVLTRSRTPAAPVEWCRALLTRGTAAARGILVNSGNANAFTGKEGALHVRESAEAAARVLGCQAREIFVASTGVIGEPLPVARIVDAMPTPDLATVTSDDWQKAARAIMTTDTFAKGASAITQIGEQRVTIAGIAKGSGMIAPNMATMLAFVFTDAALPAPVLRTLLKSAVRRSFDCITVDGDTSPSDTVLLAATGAVRNTPRWPWRAAALKSFRAALDTVMRDLAVQVVRDGEGASHLIRIEVGGARSAASARRAGLAIGNSPLVKTAIAGGDANWGRIVMALGACGEPLRPERLCIRIGGTVVAERGRRAGDYDERMVSRHLQQPEVVIAVDLGVGRGAACVWSCDLTHDYIRINADYRS